MLFRRPLEGQESGIIMFAAAKAAVRLNSFICCCCFCHDLTGTGGSGKPRLQI